MCLGKREKSKKDSAEIACKILIDKEVMSLKVCNAFWLLVQWDL